VTNAHQPEHRHHPGDVMHVIDAEALYLAGDDIDPDAELERILAKFGPDAFGTSNGAGR
jgi:hypothetical protein